MVRQRWWTLHLWCPWGVLPAPLTSFPNQPLDSNAISLKETLLVYVQHVLLQDLGNAFFPSVTYEKNERKKLDGTAHVEMNTAAIPNIIATCYKAEMEWAEII